ncbi:hypothetical protein RAS12_12215 [Achromobacter seleniivolatilans]|uniref:Phage tail tape measure protein domain-containing protein n=1 Tax=Achromobacter seleniivolatilans TaxID=3047478 RepID=A0ABY9M905_9BURK|nr:hypothetical protein [Achromobacter sp. R39]WMD23103.1 hypothetical protein RAS12_12215 [Achromobacter sp. R39]
MSNTNMKVALEIVVSDRGSKEAAQAVSVVAQKKHEASRQEQRDAAAVVTAVSVVAQKKQEAARQEQRDGAVVSASNSRYIDQSRRASVQLAQQQIASSRHASSQILRDTERLHSARARLGIRSEKSLQREIVQTAIAYKRLEDSGRVSGRELARAAEAAQRKVKMLQREMRELKTPSEWGKGLAAIGGGVMAGVAIAKRPLSDTMAYDQQIAAMSNTAYASEGIDGRREGQREISFQIGRAVRQGGTREDAADALNELLGSSGLSRDEAFSMLPTVQKTGLAAGRKSREIVPLVGALKANNIPVADMPAALGKMLHAGETGGYGIENMITSLPKLLASQRDNYGISGMKGLEMALVDMQAITAGTNMPQESAQSLMALMNTLKQPAVSQAVAKKLSIGGKGVDLAGTLGKGALRDISPLETFAAVVDKSMGNNQVYKQLQGRLANGGTQADREQMTTLLESSVFRDVGIGRESLMALSGYMSQRGAIKGLRSEYAGVGVGALETSSSVMMATAGEQVNQANQAIADARHNALKPVTDVMGDLANKITKYADTYPGLTTAIVGATDGIKVMAGAALAFGGIKMVTGAGVGVGAVAAGTASGVSSVAGRAASVLAPTRFLGSGVLARSAPLASVALGGYDALGVSGSDITQAEKNAAYTRIGGRTGGGMAGAYAGGQALAFLGPYGVAAGAIGGGLLGSLGGDWAGEKLGQAWFGSGVARPETGSAASLATGGFDPAAMQRAIISANRASPQKMEVKVILDGREIAASVNEHNSRDARRD